MIEEPKTPDDGTEKGWPEIAATALATWKSHMSQEETELLGYLDEYEAARYARGRLADATAELAAFRIAEHYSLIRKAIYRRPL